MIQKTTILSTYLIKVGGEVRGAWHELDRDFGGVVRDGNELGEQRRAVGVGGRDRGHE